MIAHHHISLHCCNLYDCTVAFYIISYIIVNTNYITYTSYINIKFSHFLYESHHYNTLTYISHKPNLPSLYISVCHCLPPSNKLIRPPELLIHAHQLALSRSSNRLLLTQICGFGNAQFDATEANSASKGGGPQHRTEHSGLRKLMEMSSGFVQKILKCPCLLCASQEFLGTLSI